MNRSPPRGGVIETARSWTRPLRACRLLVEAWIETPFASQGTILLSRLLVEAWIETLPLAL